MTREKSQFVPGLGKRFLTPLYDVVQHVFGLRPIHERMITLADLDGGLRVLDVGCGTGNLLRATGRRHPRVDLTGVDPDPAMLSRAARKARRAGLTFRLDRGFAQELPYQDDAFDRVFSSLMLHHLDTASKDSLLAEVRRVLRPDGVLILADATLAHDRKGRMSDNVGDAVSRRIAAAGLTVEPSRTMPLRVGGTVSIEVARPA